MKLTQKKYHWFEVRFVYTKNGTKILDWVRQIGLSELKLTLDRRKLKEGCHETLYKNSTKKYLCNAKLDVEIMCYLGKFSNS